jgi:hypothetical protein
MASIIIFSTLWGIALKEWKGASGRTWLLVAFSLLVLVSSTVIVGYGNYVGGIATLYPLGLDDPKTGFHNLLFLSDEHVDAIRFAATAARKLGLRVDITLGSGWPFGCPHIPVTQAAGELRVEIIPVPPGTDSVPVPDIATGEQLIAAFLAPVGEGLVSLRDAKQVSPIVDGRLRISPPSEIANDAIFFISSHTGMTVKRPAFGAERFVLDYYDRSAIEAHLHAVGDRSLEAFGDQPPYAIFSDSLEDCGSNWTLLWQEYPQHSG